MSTIKPVKDPTADPQKGKPKPKSGSSCPYYDLDQSITVAKTIHEQGGGACSREQLAPLLKYSGTNNGGFLTRVSAAKMFGLIEEGNETIRITERAKSILSPVMPQDADRAKLDAFLGVGFFRDIYERFKGQALPQEVGLKNLFENTYQIVPGRVVPSLRVLMDSADTAGFFKTVGNRSRMVMPVGIGDGSAAQTAEFKQKEAAADAGDKGENTYKHERRGRSAGDIGGHEIPSALIGLLEKLPPAGTPIPPKRRTALTDSFKSLIDFLYPDPEDGDVK
jgi:hypothetical protein